MAVRQEQLVFAGTCLLAGILVWSNRGGGSGDASRARDRGNRAEVQEYPAPEVDRLSGGSESGGLRNALFSPPRDTRELDPLSFEPPPRPALIALAPPPVDLAPALYAQFLHGRPGDVEDAFVDPFAELIESLDLDGETAEAADLSALGLQELSLSQRMELIESYKQVYDWVRLGEGAELEFGKIQNDDPWGLLFGGRIVESVQFVVFNPESGAPRMAGAPPIELTRDRVTDLGFAATPTNELELAYRALPPEPTPGTADSMLELADRCIEVRHEAPRAFELARELYEKVGAFRPDDVQPGVGLARCLELELDLSGAVQAYDGLCDRFGYRPEPWIGRARLEAGLLLSAQAEASLSKALEVDKSGWRAAGALGGFLLEQDRPLEAVAFLESANQNAPQATEDRDLRTELRRNYARALLASGRVDDASTLLAQALRAAPDDQTLNALALSADRMGATGLNVPDDLEELAEGEGVLGFDLLIAGAHRDTALGEWEAAGDGLRRALEVDPLRTAEALRLLSWISESTGSTAQAAQYADAALAADPTHPWTLFQRARLALADGDAESAEVALKAALTIESEFEDALALIALAHFLREDHDGAERFLERALVLSERRVQGSGAETQGDRSPRADLLALRGLNAIERQRFAEASVHFEAALGLDRTDFLSRAGLAWCEYRSDRPEEARIQLRNLDDALRGEAENDSRRVWAREQLTRIEDHLAKDIWSDTFEYTKIGNDWKREEVSGPVARLDGGVLFLEGVFRTSGQARFFREYSASEFVAIEADVWVGSGSTSRAGLFVARENRRSAGDEVQALLSIARARDGSTQTRLLQPGRNDAGWQDLSSADFPFPTDTWMRLRIERQGQGSDTVVHLFMDGIPVAENVPMAGLGRQNSPLKLGVFAEGESGRVAEVRLDNVDVTRRKR